MTGRVEKWGGQSFSERLQRKFDTFETAGVKVSETGK
jgi:hypothetical protein